MEVNVLRAYRDFAVELAQEAGTTIREAFRLRHGFPLALPGVTDHGPSDAGTSDASTATETKDGNSSDLVTATDRAVECRLRDRILERYPNHRCVGEEFGSGSGQPTHLAHQQPTWVMDPIGELSTKLG